MDTSEIMYLILLTARAGHLQKARDLITEYHLEKTLFFITAPLDYLLTGTEASLKTMMLLSEPYQTAVQELKQELLPFADSAVLAKSAESRWHTFRQ